MEWRVLLFEDLQALMDVAGVVTVVVVVVVVVVCPVVVSCWKSALF